MALLIRGTILDQALKRAGNMKLKALARVALNQILDDLFTQYDWDFLYTSVDGTLTGATFTLPSTYLDTQDDDALVITAINNTLCRHVVHQLDRQSFERARGDANLVTTSAPTVWCVDRPAGVGRLWPVAAESFPYTLRYKTLPANPSVSDTATYDANFPLWYWPGYLIDAVYQWALDYEQDSRADTEKLKLDAQLDRIRQVAMPFKSQLPEVGLDQRFFSTPYYED